MVCYYCKKNTVVVNSRIQIKSNSVWRRRRCLVCGNVMTTSEKYDLSSLIMVENKEKRLNPFKRDILFLSIYNCLSHLKQPLAISESLTDTVLSRIMAEQNSSKIDTKLLISITYTVLSRFDRLAADQYIANH